MQRTVKYITIGIPVDDDAIRNLPKSEQTPEKVMNIIEPSKTLGRAINPVSLSKALNPKDVKRRKGSIVPEITLADVEKFVNGSDFILMVLSVGFPWEYEMAIKVIQLVKDTKIPFHIILARPFSFAMIEDMVDVNDKKIEAITDKITKTNLYYDAFENFSPETATKEMFKQISKQLHSLMQNVIKEKAK